MDLSMLRRPTANYGTQAPKSRGVDLSNLRRPEPIFDPETIASGNAGVVDDITPKLRPPVQTIQAPIQEPELPPLNPPIPPESRARVVYPETRERINPNAPTPTMGEETALERLRRIVATKAQDENGRLKSGLWNAVNAPTRPTNSIGDALGQRVGSFLMGLLNPKVDEEAKRQRAIIQEQQQVTLDEQQAKAARDKAEQEANIKNTQSRTELVNAQKDYTLQRPDLQRDAQEKAALDRRRRMVVSQINNLKEYDPQDPQFADLTSEAKELGIPVYKKSQGNQYKIEQDPASGQFRVISVNKSTGAATSSTVTDENGQPLVMTSREKFQQDWRTAENDKQRQAILERSNADRAVRLQIAEKRIEAGKKKGEYSNDSYFRTIDNQLSDVWGELSQLQSEISKRKTNGEEIPDWMNQRQASLRKEARRLELIVAKEQDKMRKAGNVPMPENQPNPSQQQKRGMQRKNIPELMKRKGFKTEQEAIDWLQQNGITLID